MKRPGADRGSIRSFRLSSVSRILCGEDPATVRAGSRSEAQCHAASPLLGPVTRRSITLTLSTLRLVSWRNHATGRSRELDCRPCYRPAISQSVRRVIHQRERHTVCTFTAPQAARAYRAVSGPLSSPAPNCHCEISVEIERLIRSCISVSTHSSIGHRVSDSECRAWGSPRHG